MASIDGVVRGGCGSSFPRGLARIRWMGLRIRAFGGSNAGRIFRRGKLKGEIPPKGARIPLESVHLRLVNRAVRYDENPALLKSLKQIPRMSQDNYAIAVLHLSPTGNVLTYAGIRETQLFNPGSVGKLAILAGLFAELKNRYPNDPAARLHFLKTRMISAGAFAIGDEHKVPFYDPATMRLVSRPVQLGDRFSLYEWADHMISASANSAASEVWREVILMRAFGDRYPVSETEAAAYFRTTPKAQLSQLALSIVNDPLRKVGIGQNEWQLGTIFSRYGKSMIPGAPSYASPKALMTYLVAIESGTLVDSWSSLEMKRIMLTTTRRIRYASSPALNGSAVYYKSGSYYSYQPGSPLRHRKYMGDARNFMNSVAIVENPDGSVYWVTMMSNVLRRNSAVDHQTLATRIHRTLTR